jgi:hypothetical protein
MILFINWDKGSVRQAVIIPHRSWRRVILVALAGDSIGTTNAAEAIILMLFMGLGLSLGNHKVGHKQT